MADHDKVVVAFHELGRLVLADRSLGESLGQIADIIRSVLPAAREVSVTLIPPRGQPYTAAFSTGSELAAALDEHQYRTGSGPCLHAAATGETVTISDTTRSRRYPDFARRAHQAGIDHTLSIGMPSLHQTSGALNIYGVGSPFPGSIRALATDLAGYAGVALVNASLYSDALAEIRQIRDAMASRAVIEQAKGIIMTRRRCDAGQAFELLRQASSRTHRKVRDIAQDIVAATAHDPAQPAPDGSQARPQTGARTPWVTRTG